MAAAVVPVWAAAPVSAAVLVLAVVLAEAPEVLAHPLALPRLHPVKGCGRSPFPLCLRVLKRERPLLPSTEQWGPVPGT